MASSSAATATTAQSQVSLPRITITFCTQCKWLLRAAWLQQELLSTFGTSIGEIALVPSTGGIFQIHLLHHRSASAPGPERGVVGVAEENEVGDVPSEVLLWDRKAEQGFPEAKMLKQRVRDCIEPGRGLGHSDTPSSRTKGGEDGRAEGKGEGEGKEGPASVDLAGGLREKGPGNPLVRRMRPDVAERGESRSGDAGDGGENCEDCQ